MKEPTPTQENRAGHAIDSTGSSVVDPTTNVLGLVEAAVKRIDDLRDCNAKWSVALNASVIARIDDIRAAESRRIDEQASLRADYHEKLSAAEAKRIDAIRAVDVNAVAVASDRATQQATVLATQVSQSAETLRSLVASTATTLANQLQQMSNQFTERIATLEKSSNIVAGRAGVADPQIEKLSGLVDNLARAQQTTAGKGEGISASFGVIIGVVGLIATLITVGAFIFTRDRDPRASVPAPQIIYMPSATLPTTK